MTTPTNQPGAGDPGVEAGGACGHQDTPMNLASLQDLAGALEQRSAALDRLVRDAPDLPPLGYVIAGAALHDRVVAVVDLVDRLARH